MSIDLPESRLAELERENAALAHRLRQLERENASQQACGERQAFASLESILDATHRIFGGDVRIQVDHDAEHAQEKYLTLRVAVEGSPAEIMELERRWIEELREPLRHWQCGLLIQPK